MMTKTPLLLLLLATAASADTYRQHGSTCAPKHTSRDSVGYDERGIYNSSSSATATVTCAAAGRTSHEELYYSGSTVRETWTRNSVVESVSVFGRDLSDTLAFSCYLFGTQSDGFSSWGPTKYTCSQAGGCPDPTFSFTGNATLSWTMDQSFGALDHIGVVCNMPPTTAAGSSYVKAVVVKDLAHADYDSSNNLSHLAY